MATRLPRRAWTTGIMVLLLGSMLTISADPDAFAGAKPEPSSSPSQAAGRNRAAPPKIVPKKQQYHIDVTVGQGSQVPVDMASGITKITSITEKHLDPRAPQLRFTF